VRAVGKGFAATMPRRNGLVKALLCPICSRPETGRMGSRNPDRVPLAYRRRRCETVTQMTEQGWDVLSSCDKCGLQMLVDLRMIAKVRGPTFSLWSRRSRCRRIGCGGVVRFKARAPGMGWYEELDAPWPDGKPPAKRDD